MNEAKNKNEESWSFRDESEAYSGAEEPSREYAEIEQVTWTGSEFIENQKTFVWFLALGLFIATVCAVIYLLTKDEISVVFIVIMGILFGVIAGRKPRQLQYTIGDDGITVGNRSYLYSDFKSFSLQHHDAIGYISLLPLHRFHNELSIYYPPDLEEKIFNNLANFLPNEQRKENYVDYIAKLIRF